MRKMKLCKLKASSFISHNKSSEKMNITHRLRSGFSLALLILVALCACSPFHTTIFHDSDNASQKVKFDFNYATEIEEFLDEEGQLPLDRVLYHIGYQVVDRISVIQAGQPVQEYQWADVAEQTYWRKDGSILINEEIFSPEEILVRSDPLADQSKFDITDLANTILSALSLPLLESEKPSSQTELKASHVFYVFWDGLGYLDIQKAIDLQIVPTMASLPKPVLGLSVYPSITSVATAAMITGLPPGKNGVAVSGVRSTNAMTIFDQMNEGAKEYIIIEGNTLYFNNLSGEHLLLNADVDGNGSTDDEIYLSTLQEIRQGLPDFTWVHFHGLDDSGHTYSPWSEEYIQSMQRIDGYLGNIIDASPADTLFIISADHGMHISTAGVRSGEHGTLMAQDMLIPLVIYLKSSSEN